MTSNKLCPKSDKVGFRLYKEIFEKRWLHRKDNRILLRFLSRNYLFFHEYATLINFNEHFLNLVSAIREWDISNNN